MGGTDNKGGSLPRAEGVGMTHRTWNNAMVNSDKERWVTTWLCSIKNKLLAGLVVPAFIPITQEEEAGRSYECEVNLAECLLMLRAVKIAKRSPDLGDLFSSTSIHVFAHSFRALGLWLCGHRLGGNCGERDGDKQHLYSLHLQTISLSLQESTFWNTRVPNLEDQTNQITYPLRLCLRPKHPLSFRSCPLGEFSKQVK